jgi:hypothetical protein
MGIQNRFWWIQKLGEEQGKKVVKPREEAIGRKTVFCVRGKKEFVEGFENLLKANGIDYSRPQSEEMVIKEPTRMERETYRIEKGFLYNRLKMISVPEVIRFLLPLTPTILKMIYDWYSGLRSKGTIHIETAEGTVIKLNAKSVKNFQFIEKKPKKKRSAKKRGKTHRTKGKSKTYS